MKRILFLVLICFFRGEVAMGYESIYPKTPAGRIEVKQIPARTILRAAGQGDPFQGRDESFKKLFGYIKSNKVAMTVPVEAGGTSNTMNFLVGGADAQKELKPAGEVKIEKLPPATVVSAGVRGAYTRAHFEAGRHKIEAWLAQHPEWRAEGEAYAVYWNSPFVPGFLKSAEIHQPVHPAAKGAAGDVQPSLYGFTMKDIDGQDVKLETYKGKVLLIVNVASRCGFTPQYAGLEALYRKYQGQGLVILGFPANNFMGQEPGTNEEIKAFCSAKYNVTFPIFAKISVKGQDQHPLYQYLTEQRTNPDFGGEITWNFNKFLVNRQGRIVNRFATRTKPDDDRLIQAVEQALKEKP